MAPPEDEEIRHLKDQIEILTNKNQAEELLDDASLLSYSERDTVYLVLSSHLADQEQLKSPDPKSNKVVKLEAWREALEKKGGGLFGVAASLTAAVFVAVTAYLVARRPKEVQSMRASTMSKSSPGRISSRTADLLWSPTHSMLPQFCSAMEIGTGS